MEPCSCLPPHKLFRKRFPVGQAKELMPILDEPVEHADGLTRAEPFVNWKEEIMPAYWMARVTVTDKQAYDRHAERVPGAIRPFGGWMLARGGRSTTLEGSSYERNVIIVIGSIRKT